MQALASVGEDPVLAEDHRLDDRAVWERQQHDLGVAGHRGHVRDRPDPRPRRPAWIGVEPDDVMSGGGDPPRDAPAHVAQPYDPDRAPSADIGVLGHHVSFMRDCRSSGQDSTAVRTSGCR